MALRVAITGRLMVVLVVMALSCLGCEGRGCHDNERAALLEIKKLFNPSNISYMYNWGDSTMEEGKDCCQWPGITCNPNTGHVVELYLFRSDWSDVKETWHPNLTMLAEFGQLENLNLPQNKIGGGIPKAICHLKHLKTLDMSRNELEGFIPSCLCTLRSLIKLDLSSNHLLGDIPSCFGSFHYLTSLSLSSNLFQWNDSSWLCNMHSLTYLDISNSISPSNIPSCIGNLNRLNFLEISSDGFKGSIPSSIFSNLTNLITLNIRSGELEGNLQFSVLANLSKLEDLSISSGGGLEINTEYPISWVPSFQLKYLSISNSVVNSHSGNRLPSFLKTQGRLKWLFFDNTSIKGTLPTGLFCNSTLSLLSLSGNSFFGPFLLPSCNGSQNLYFIDLSYNDLNGLPENLGFFFPKLRVLQMRRNKLEGHIPKYLGHTPLYSLDLSGNILSGKLPPTLMRNRSELSCLDVSYNQLEGEIIPIDAEMPNLEVLIAHNNNFTSLLFPRLTNFSSLRVIDVGYNSLTYNFSQSISYFPNMLILSLRTNYIQGQIPKQLCQMQQLRLLDLSRNNLSGKLLSCLHNISSWRSKITDQITRIGQTSETFGFHWWSIISSNPGLLFKSKKSIRLYKGEPLNWMTHLDLSMNLISGIIPQEIGELQGLQSLDLSKNHIQGSLPKSMADMYNLQSLDLSYNGLSGSIPNEMVRLFFLSDFNIAFNNMTSMIPDGIQFRTFNESNFEGNPGLCGPPLKKECSSNNERAKRITTKDYKDALFFAFIMMSFTLSFSGFLVSLFLNKSWRMKYFKFIDQYCNM